MAITVKRGGETSSIWSGSGWDVRLARRLGEALLIKFKIASKGGGTTDILVKIEKDSFDDVARTMFRTSNRSAMSAFIDALRGSEAAYRTIAILMLRAAPDAAIRAFGGALQDYSADRSSSTGSGPQTRELAA